MKLIRIVKSDIGNWELGHEQEMPDDIAAELVREGHAEYIKKLTERPAKKAMTFAEVNAKAAELNSKIGAA